MRKKNSERAFPYQHKLEPKNLSTSGLSRLVGILQVPCHITIFILHYRVGQGRANPSLIHTLTHGKNKGRINGAVLK